MMVVFRKMTEPVLLVVLSSSCAWCDYLLKNWDVTINALLTVKPNIRFPVPTEKTKHYKYPPIIIEHNQLDPIYPKDLLNYHVLWAPMIMVVPGQVWDDCMKNKQKKLEGLEIMNSHIVNKKLEYIQKWDIRKPENFTNWLSEVLKISVSKPTQLDTKVDLKCQNVYNLVSYY